MNEIKPRETVNAMKIIEDNFNYLIKQNEELRKQLELTEKRALEWEQMHLDELTQRQELQRELSLLKENMKGSLGEGMQRLAAADRVERLAWQKETEAKHDAHNARIREQIEKQTRIQEAGHLLHAQDVKRAAEGQDYIIRSVIATEKQTLLMENISQCLSEMVAVYGKR